MRSVTKGRFTAQRAWTVTAASLALLLAACAGGPAAESADEVAARMDAELDTYFETADRWGQVRAVLVYHDGEAVLQRYTGATQDDYWDVRSVTKSVMSALIGIAIDQGYIDGVDESLGELLPTYAPEMTPDVAAITLHQVLTHTAGFPDSWSRLDDFPSSQDWVRSILTDRAEAGPSEGSFAYSDAGTHLLSAILAEATGQSVLAYARVNLFEPLGIDTDPAWESPTEGPAGASAAAGSAALQEAFEEYYAAGFAWPVDPQGYNLGYNLLKVHPADLARIGLTYLADGTWEGRQVVPASWVAESTTAQVDASGAADAYGYLWWVTDVDGDAAYVAWGYGGQLIEVIPDRDLVVVLATEYDELDVTGPIKAVGPQLATYMVSLVIAPHFANP